VHDTQECPQAAALPGGELAAVPVASLDPGVQGVGVPADHGDRVAVVPGQGRGHRHAQVGEALGGPVLADDRGRSGGLGVEVVLEEVPAPGGGEPVAAVEEPLVDGFTDERGTGGVPLQERAQWGRVEHRGWYG
jgi:hypothetical protein